MTAAAAKIKAKRARRPVYLVVTRLIDGATGRDVGALVPANDIDARLLRERGFHMGKEIRAELKQPRNGPFHRLAHAIGNLLVDNVEEFRDMGGHEALKAIQLRSGVCCEMIEMDATPVVAAILDAAEAMLGAGARKVLAGVLPDIKTIPVKIARSLAFDEMPEDEFALFFKGVTQYIADNFASVMLDEIRAEFFLMVEGERT